VGVAIGMASAILITVASRHLWVENGGRRIATLAATISSFAVAVSLEGNGFIAAFVAGISFGAMLKRDVTPVHVATELPELLGEVMALVVWFIFGALLVPLDLDHLDQAPLAYAVLSLTVARMLPVAQALLGTGLSSRTVLFMGWFGPRGLASIVFALLDIEELGEGALVEQAVAVVGLTVMLSVVLHGVTAGLRGAATCDCPKQTPRQRPRRPRNRHPLAPPCSRTGSSGDGCRPHSVMGGGSTPPMALPSAACTWTSIPKCHVSLQGGRQPHHVVLVRRPTRAGQPVLEEELLGDRSV
jgi:sodium/hydrogen antiporter